MVRDKSKRWLCRFAPRICSDFVLVICDVWSCLGLCNLVCQVSANARNLFGPPLLLMFSRRFKPQSWARRRRNLHSLTPSSPFKILFLGRDEFSCLVLDELHKHKGSFGLQVVIQEALKPNKISGRRYWSRHNPITGLEGGAPNCPFVRLNVMNQDFSLGSSFTAPLKLKAQQLGLEPHFLPPKSEFKHWLVRLLMLSYVFLFTS